MAEWKQKKISITLDTPDEAELFLRALQASRDAGHGSDHILDLIEATGEALEPYRRDLVLEEVAARESPSD